MTRLAWRALKTSTPRLKRTTWRRTQLKIRRRCTSTGTRTSWIAARACRGKRSRRVFTSISPMYQYRHADIVDCGKGMQGKKVTKGLYIDIAGGPEGWVEVCSEDFFTAQGTPADIGKKNCDNSKALL